MANNTLDLIALREALKTEVPRLLREHPEVRHEIAGLMTESFPTREEVNRRLEEMPLAVWEKITYCLEQLDHRAGTLEGQMEAGFEEARRERQELGQRVERLEQRVEAGFEEARQERQELGQRVERLENRVEAGFEEARRERQELGQRVERLENRVEAGFEEARRERQELGQRVERLENRVEAGFEEARQERQELKQRVERLEQRVEAGFEEARRERQRIEEKMDAGFEEARQERQELRRATERLEQRVEDGFKMLQRQIDRLGQRWGIHNESIFRQTIATLLEESFGAKVESRWIDGEQYDVIITNGQQILLEITASAGPKIQQRLERKRDLYTQATGTPPTRIILAAAAIHSRRVRALEQAGIEVIEPEEDEELE
jgi:hypothetical protein